MALLFPRTMRELNWMPNFCSRQLGECFSVFICGHWRVIIRGSRRTQQVLDSVGLQEGWAWSPPKVLLGSSCLPLLDESEAELMVSLIRRPLSYDSVVRFAPDFAVAAEKFVDDLLSGESKKEYNKKESHDSDSDEFTVGDEEMGWKSKTKSHKIKYDMLRSFTLDLINGPVLNLDMWKNKGERETREPTEEAEGQAEPKNAKTNSKKKKEPPSRNMMVLWMERVEDALLAIKMTVSSHACGVVYNFEKFLTNFLLLVWSPMLPNVAAEFIWSGREWEDASREDSITARRDAAKIGTDSS